MPYVLPNPLTLGVVVAFSGILNLIFSLIVSLIIYGVFGLLGGYIAVRFFLEKKKKKTEFKPIKPIQPLKEPNFDFGIIITWCDFYEKDCCGTIGAGGATVARELSKKGKTVTLLEKGPYTKIKYAYKHYENADVGVETAFLKTSCIGGTTLVTAGNAVRTCPEPF